MTDLLPYDARPGQREFVDLVRDCARSGRSAVIESGTGTGKTVLSLTGTLEASGPKRVIFLTRTKSQQRQVSLEARAIGSRADILCVAVQGRGPATCPMMAEDRDLADGTSEEMSKLCSELKNGRGAAGSCRYHEALRSSEIKAVLAYARTAHPDPEEFRAFCLSRGVCPYEAAKRILPYANVVSAPYAFYFIPPIRAHLMQWMGVSERDCVVIVDEAHNLPSYLRDMQTCRVTRRFLELAEREAESNGDPEIGEGLAASDMVRLIRDILEDAVREYLRRDNDMIPASYLSEEMMCRLGMGTQAIRGCVGRLLEAGDSIAEARKAKRKLPRSRLASLARFVIGWWSCEESSHVFLVSGGDNPALEAYCLDPEDAAEPLRLCRSSVSISGTLAPLGPYSRELGLYDPEMRVFPSPFPRANLRTLYVADVSTKFSEINSEDGTFERLREHIVSIVTATDRSAAVFFPSYAVMDRFVADGLVDDLGRDVYCERRGMPQSELMDQVTDFRDSGGSVLFAVTGGRVSEGLDFPGKELEVAVIVGIPYSRPSAKQDALVGYCQNRFGKGWEYAVKVPAVRKMRQAIGRLIRSERDRGVAVILDRRAAGIEGIDAELTDDPVREVREFFRGFPRPIYIPRTNPRRTMAIQVDDDVRDMILREKQDYRVCTACMGPALVPISVKCPKESDIRIPIGENSLYISGTQAPFMDRVTMDMLYDEDEIDSCPAFYVYSDRRRGLRRSQDNLTAASAALSASPSTPLFSNNAAALSGLAPVTTFLGSAVHPLAGSVDMS